MGTRRHETVTRCIGLAAAIGLFYGVPGSAAVAQPGGVAPMRAVALHEVARIAVGGVPTDVAAASRDVWVATGVGGVVRVDGDTNRVIARIRTGGSVSAVAVGLGAVWALDILTDHLIRIDPRANRIVRRVEVDPLPSGLATGHGLVWVASQLASTVAGIDPRTSRVLKLARFRWGELWPGGLAVGPPGVWVVTGGGAEVSLFDPAVMRFRYRIQLPGARTLAPAGRDIWVGMAQQRGLVRIGHGQIRRLGGLARSNGYGPELAARACVWVVQPDGVAALDRASGRRLARYRVTDAGALGPLAVTGDVWAVDTEHAELLRIDTAPLERHAVASRNVGNSTDSGVGCLP